MKRLIPKSKFGRNVLILMTGTTIAQAIPIIIMPILTRIYTPEDFGLLALFVAITTILGTVANARYELAITLPESEDVAIEIAALGVVIATLFAFLLLVPCVFFNKTLSILLNESDFSFWLYFVPLVVWIIGIFNVLSYLNIRCKNYKDIAKAHIYKSVSMVGVQLIWGIINANVAGLILGQIASSISSVYRLSKNIDVEELYYNVKRWKKLKSSVIRYKRFLIYMFPASLMNALFGNAISLVTPIIFEMKTLGFYALAQRSLGAPMSLIGSSISQVYAQEASEERHATGKVIFTFNRTLKKLIFLSVLFFSPLFFVIEDVFALAFGEDWRIAGYYASLLLPYFALNFIVSSLSLTDSIMEKQYIYAFFNAVKLFLMVFLIFFFVDNFVSFIKIFVFVFSIINVIYLLAISFVARGKF